MLVASARRLTGLRCRCPRAPVRSWTCAFGRVDVVEKGSWRKGTQVGGERPEMTTKRTVIGTVDVERGKGVRCGYNPPRGCTLAERDLTSSSYLVRATGLCSSPLRHRHDVCMRRRCTPRSRGRWCLINGATHGAGVGTSSYSSYSPALPLSPLLRCAPTTRARGAAHIVGLSAPPPHLLSRREARRPLSRGMPLPPPPAAYHRAIPGVGAVNTPAQSVTRPRGWGSRKAVPSRLTAFALSCQRLPANGDGGGCPQWERIRGEGAAAWCSLHRRWDVSAAANGCGKVTFRGPEQAGGRRKKWG